MESPPRFSTGTSGASRYIHPVDRDGRQDDETKSSTDHSGEEATTETNTDMNTAMKIEYVSMTFGPVKKIMRRYPDGTPTGSSAWGCTVEAAGQTRVLHVSGYPRKADFMGELSKVKRGAYGIRASDTIATAWCLMPRMDDYIGTVYIRQTA